MPLLVPNRADQQSRLALYFCLTAFMLMASAQIAIPLIDNALIALTTLVVATLAAVTFFLATISYGVKALFKVFAGTFLIALTAETAGHTTGFPFGAYSYTNLLQPQIFGVPLIIPLAWFAMALPAWEIANRLTVNKWLRPLLGGLLLMAWDLMLDPQMVTNGFWVWQNEGPWYGIPTSNFLGWTAVATVLCIFYSRVLGTEIESPLLILPYVWMGFFTAFGFILPFVFDIPLIGIVGGLAMLIPAAVVARRYERPWLR